MQERNQRFRAILGKNAHSAFYLFNNILNLTSLTVMMALSFYLRNSRESPRFTSSGSIFQVLHFKFFASLTRNLDIIAMHRLETSLVLKCFWISAVRRGAAEFASLTCLEEKTLSEEVQDEEVSCCLHGHVASEEKRGFLHCVCRLEEAVAFSERTLRKRPWARWEMAGGTQKTEMWAELPASLKLPAVEQTAAVTSGLWFWFLRTASRRRLVRSSVTTPLRLGKKKISCFSAAENVIMVSHVGFCLVKEKKI